MPKGHYTPRGRNRMLVALGSPKAAKLKRGHAAEAARVKAGVNYHLGNVMKKSVQLGPSSPKLKPSPKLVAATNPATAKIKVGPRGPITPGPRAVPYPAPKGFLRKRLDTAKSNAGLIKQAIVGPAKAAEVTRPRLRQRVEALGVKPVKPTKLRWKSFVQAHVDDARLERDFQRTRSRKPGNKYILRRK